MPLPSIRTLTRKLENLKFDSGISDNVFKFLGIKKTYFNDIDVHVGIVLDEMQILVSKSFDASLNSSIGKVTLPNHTNGLATHALVILIVGIGSRWKQIVGYYFTSNSVDGSVLQSISLKVIKKAEDIGLRVHFVTSDMGAANQAMWKTFGISKTKNCCQHPLDENRKLYFFADVPHSLKNLKESLLINKFFYHS